MASGMGDWEGLNDVASDGFRDGTSLDGIFFFFFFFLTKRVSDSRVATLLSPAAVAVATGRKD